MHVKIRREGLILAGCGQDAQQAPRLWSSPLVPMVWDAQVLLVGDAAGTARSPALGFPSRSALGQPLFVTSFGSGIPFLLLYLGPESAGGATSGIDGGTHGHHGTTPGTERCPKPCRGLGALCWRQQPGGCWRHSAEARRGHSLQKRALNPDLHVQPPAPAQLRALPSRGK